MSPAALVEVVHAADHQWEVIAVAHDLLHAQTRGRPETGHLHEDTTQETRTLHREESMGHRIDMIVVEHHLRLTRKELANSVQMDVVAEEHPHLPKESV